MDIVTDSPSLEHLSRNPACCQFTLLPILNLHPHFPLIQPAPQYSTGWVAVGEVEGSTALAVVEPVEGSIAQAVEGNVIGERRSNPGHNGEAF